MSKGIKPPKNEIILVQYIKDDKPVYIITSTMLRDMYYLYKVENDKLVKTKHKNKTPTELEKYMDL